MRVCAPGHGTRVNSPCFCALEDAGVEEREGFLENPVSRLPDALSLSRAEVIRPDLFAHYETGMA